LILEPRLCLPGRMDTTLDTTSSTYRFRIAKADPWTIVAIALSALIVLPVAAVLYLAFNPTENIWPHLLTTSLPRYVKSSLLLMLGVGVTVSFIGVTTAWLVTMCRFPGRQQFEWLLALPFAVPAYVIAYIYTDLLEYAGPVQALLRSVFGWQRPADYWFPEIRSLSGAILVMSLVLYPYVYLLTRSAFLDQSPAMIDASRVMGYGPWRSFLRVSIPLARPAIAIGLALTLMETLNDFGTVDYFAVRTLTAGIYDVWLGMGNLGGAAQIAAVMLLFITLLVMTELSGRRRQRYYQADQRFKTLPTYPLRGWRMLLAVLCCALPVVLGFVIPGIVLLGYTIGNWHESWTPEFRTYATHSVLLSAAAGLTTIVLASVLAYGQRIRGHAVVKVAHRMASIGYAVPGAVLAIGIMIPLAKVDNTIDALMRQYAGISTGLILSGSVFALVYAYVVRFLAISLGAIEASLDKISPDMDMAARTLGHKPGKIFLLLHLPLIRGGALTAGLIVFVDCMKELPTTLILRPFNFETLATQVYQFASDELIEQASLGALSMVLCGLIPVALLVRTIAQSRQL
jgi:iron(III) transport system permease protein